MNVPVRNAMASTTAARNHGCSIGIDVGPGHVKRTIGLAILTWEMAWLSDIKIAKILILST